MRKLTKPEVEGAPHWAKAYFIQVQSNKPIFYAFLDSGTAPIPNEDFDNKEITDLKQEIADLKLAVQFQYNAAMTLDEENQIARKEINELKAMVNALRRAADLYHGGYKVSELEEANSIMNMSPAQCLQSVKADAIIEAIEALKPSQHGDSSMIIACEHFLSYANKLREGES